MSIEIIDGCGCCGPTTARITFCDLKLLFLNLYNKSTTVATNRNLIAKNLKLEIIIIIDNTGSISYSQWQPNAINLFKGFIYNLNLLSNVKVVQINNYVNNMEDWIYDSYREIQNSNNEIIIVINTMDSSVHYNSLYNYSIPIIGTDRELPSGITSKSHLELYEYDVGLFNQLVQSSSSTKIIEIGDIIGKGGGYQQNPYFKQVKNEISNLFPINSDGSEAPIVLGGITNCENPSSLIAIGGSVGKNLGCFCGPPSKTFYKNFPYLISQTFRIKIYFTTRDALFHKNAYYEANFGFSENIALDWQVSYSGTQNGNPWLITNNGKTIKFIIEDSYNCGGTNNLVQSGTAECIVSLNNAVTMTFDFDGIVEHQANGYEEIKFYLDEFI